MGASNLTLGLASALATARAAWGQDLEVLAALGYGRSYGAPSTIAMRTLPGILQSDLWRDLEALPQAPAEGLITDVGNDILYGETPERILAWVKEAADRLLTHCKTVVLTSLPAERMSRVSPRSFLFFRTIYFPPCRLSRAEVFARVDEVNRGLTDLAVSRGLRLVRLPEDWYGFDPIHFRPAMWAHAWREILIGGSGTARDSGFSPREFARLHTMRPAWRSLFGRELRAPQAGRRLRLGGRLWIY